MRYLILVLVLLTSSIAAANDIVNENIVIVLDNSGSMDGDFHGQTRMDAAKNALQLVIRQLPDSTNIGLVTINPVNFSDGTTTNWIYPISKIDKDKLSNYIKVLYSNGGTPLGAYIKVGADALLELRKKQKYGNYRLIVVTDGEAGDSQLLEKYVPDVMRRGIRFDVIGVALSNHTLSKKVTSYRSADDQQSLVQAVKEVLAETPKTDGNSEEYDIIQGLPAELASVVIKTYSESPDYEIGAAPSLSDLIPQSQSNNSESESVGTSLLTIGVIIVAILAGLAVIGIFLSR